jgi:cytochrome c2
VARYWIVIAVNAALLMGGCRALEEPIARHEVPGGDAERGRRAFVEYGCNACHTIPGVTGADAQVGPPLTNWAGRGYIAGLFPNTPEYLIRWIQNPQEMIPGSAMPDMGVPETAARDMSAYLYTLTPNR